MLSSRLFRHLITVVLVIFLLSVKTTAQTTSTEVPKKTAEEWDTLKAFGANKKQEAVEFGKGLLKETDVKISQLKEKTVKLSDEAKAQYEKDLQTLKPVRDRAGIKLDEMKKASLSAWESTKKGFADAYKDLHQAYDKAAERFK